MVKEAVNRSIITDEQCQTFARSPSLTVVEILRLFEGQVTIGDGRDPEMTRDGFRARSQSDDDYRHANAAEQAVLEEYANDIKLDFPVTPGDLLAWSKRNQTYVLPQTFIDAVEQTHGPAGKRGRHPTPTKLLDDARDAATAFYGRYSNLTPWPPRRVIRHQDFVRIVFPEKTFVSAADVKPDTQYTKRYGTSPRQLIPVVAEVWERLKSSKNMPKK